MVLHQSESIFISCLVDCKYSVLFVFCDIFKKIHVVGKMSLLLHIRKFINGVLKSFGDIQLS